MGIKAERKKFDDGYSLGLKHEKARALKVMERLKKDFHKGDTYGTVEVHALIRAAIKAYREGK